MPDKALPLPFEAGEIKKIILDEFAKKLDMCTPLMGLKEYGSFTATYNVSMTLRRAGESGFQGKETLVWGEASRGLPSADDLDAVMEEAKIADETFTAKEPNVERVARGMPVTVEVSDGKGGKTRRKVNVEKK